MSLERFSNKDSILSNNGLQRGTIWSNDILPSLMMDARTVVLNKENVSVEIHVYTRTGEYLIGGAINDYKFNNDKIQIDYAAALTSFNIPRGYFEVVTNIHSNLIGNQNELILQVKEISPDRREILIQLGLGDDDLIAKYDGAITRYLTEYISAVEANIALNFDHDRIYRIINHKPWTTPNSMVVRLYTPLADDINVNDTLWLVEELADTYIDNIQMNSAAPDSQISTLRGPNFELDSNYNTITETEFKSWTQLLNTNLASSQQIINSYFSGSLESLNVGIDYTAFENFVFYGSAYERLANFKYKLDLLEYYDSQLSLLDAADGNDTTFANNITKYNDQKQNLLGTFDNFERWLYYEPTASLTTHGTSGSFIGADSYALTPWPKYVSGSVYYVHTTDNALSQAWYNGFLATASFYDQENANALVKTIPQYIRDDENNSEYELFVNMIGQHFDILYTYINALTKTYRPEEQPKLGMDKEALYEIAQSMGWKLANGRQASSLWQYKLGVDSNGQYQTTGSLFSKSDNDITTEIWRRVVNNLPYLLKTKGTARSIKALMNVYGIPQTLLSIREYGGPHPDAETPALIEDRFAYKLFLSGSSTGTGNRLSYFNSKYVTSSGTWNSGILDSSTGYVAPITREIRFEPAVKRNMNLLTLADDVLDSIGTTITIQYTASYSGSSDYGRVWISHYSSSGVTAPFAVSASTEWLPLYDGDMWNLRWWWTGGGTAYNTTNNTNTTYYVQVQKASDYITGKVIHQASASVTPTNSNHHEYWSNTSRDDQYVRIGGKTDSVAFNKFNIGTIYPFTGYVQEYREWIERLDQNTFDIHTLNPTSYVSALNPTASYNTLLRKYAFGTDLNALDHNTFTIISSSHPANSITDFTNGDANTNINASNFAVSLDTQRGHYIPFEETYYIDAVSLGGQLPRSEKIRLEDNYLIRRLSPTNTAERSSFDYAPIDSNRVGLFYSQADQVNKDIFDHIGDIALDDYVGNPEDEFDYQYPQLRGFSTEYWKKYTNRNDINAFIRVFSQFDFTLFNQIKQLLPARVDEAMGLLVEPHALERNKIALTKRIGVENPQYDITFAGLQITASSDYLPEYTASISNMLMTTAESVYHSGSNGYVDDGNTFANIMVRDHVVPTSYLTEEVPIDQIGNEFDISQSPLSVFVLNNRGLAAETNDSGNGWFFISPVGRGINDDDYYFQANQINNKSTSQLVVEYPLNNQHDILYNTINVVITSKDDLDDGTVLSRCSLCLIDKNNIVTELQNINVSFTYVGDTEQDNTYAFTDVYIPAYSRFGVIIEYRSLSGFVWPWIDRIQVNNIQLEKVYTSAIRPEIDDHVVTSGYLKKVFYYSGSINTSDKILKNAYHATSQSLGLYYSSSLEPVNFQNDEVLQYINPRYEGCRLVGPDINVNSNITAIGNSPVIEVYETNANQLIFTNTPVNRSTGNNREPGNLTVR
jgi:hypothetical protein